jgi:hypothetical protein
MSLLVMELSNMQNQTHSMVELCNLLLFIVLGRGSNVTAR